MTETILKPGEVIVQPTGHGRFQQLVSAQGHALVADEPQSLAGLGSGLSPYELLLSSLGACTAMTVRLYADRKGLPLQDVEVRLSHGRVHADDCAKPDQATSRVDAIDREITFVGPLTEEQRQKLLDIADKCPVHRTLSAGVQIRTTLKSSETA
jgi:uncharacterized OsmC-like protein